MVGRCLREVAAEAHEGERVDVLAERDRVQRHTLLGQCPGELPRARLVLVQHQEADVPAALDERRQQREQVCLRAGDAGDLGQVEDEWLLHREPTRVTTRSAHVLDGVALEHPLPQRSSDRGALLRRERGERAEPLGQLLRALALEAEPWLDPREELVEARVRREHRQAAAARLVDGLVGRAGPHVVHEHVGTRRARSRISLRGTGSRIAARSPIPSSPISRSSRRRCSSLLGAPRGAVDVQPHVRHERHRAAGSSRSPSPARYGRARQRAAASPRSRSRHGKRRVVDPVADRHELLGLERERAAVDAEHARRDARSASASERAGASSA